MPQPLAEALFILFFIRSYTFGSLFLLPAPLIFQIITVEIRPQYRDHYLIGPIEPADFPDHQCHLGGEVISLSEQVQRQRHQAHIFAIVERIDLPSLQHGQGTAFFRRQILIKSIPLGRACRLLSDLRHTDQLFVALVLPGQNKPRPRPDIEQIPRKAGGDLV